MNHKKLQKKKESVEFALVFGWVYILLTFFPQTSSWIHYCTIPIAILMGIGVFFPAWLHPLQQLWMKLGSLMGLIVSKVLLSVVFFIILTPLAVIKKALSGKDKGENTHWSKSDRFFDKQSLENPF